MKIKCDCTPKTDGFGCPICSRVKMVILLMPGNDHLKSPGPNGDLVNPVWHSPVKQNNWTDDFIVKGMSKRFMNDHKASSTRMLQFYDKVSGKLIYEGERK